MSALTALLKEQLSDVEELLIFRAKRYLPITDPEFCKEIYRGTVADSYNWLPFILECPIDHYSFQGEGKLLSITLTP